LSSIFNPNLADEAVRVVRENKARRRSGKLNAIPIGLPRTEQYFPGVQRKNYVKFTANSGVGKSKIVKCLMVFNTFMFLRENPNCGLKLRTLYFCLEESKLSFVHSFYCYLLKKLKNVRVPIKELKSITREFPDEAEPYLDELTPIVKEFLSCVAIIDNVRNPYGIYKMCMDYIETLGHYTERRYNFHTKDSAGNPVVEVRTAKGDFIYDDPEMIVQVVIDHISLIHAEKGMDKREAMSYLSEEYLIRLRDYFMCAITDVHQQAADKEKKEFTHKGASIEEKLRPSLDGLGDNKAIQRDADEIFGLFAPDRYGITECYGYDISQLQDNYRSLIFLKSRDGDSNIEVGLFFDGGCNHFEELPTSGQMRQQDYQRYLEKAGRGPVQREINFV